SRALATVISMSWPPGPISRSSTTEPFTPCRLVMKLSTRGHTQVGLSGTHVVPQLTRASCQRLRKQFLALVAPTRSDVPRTDLGSAGIIFFFWVCAEHLLKVLFGFLGLAGVRIDLSGPLPVAPLGLTVQDLVNQSLAFGFVPREVVHARAPQQLPGAIPGEPLGLLQRS